MNSYLQIISGARRGMKLALPDGPTRPTQNRARIALFNILNEILPATSTRHQPLITVWDAFAGSGAFGLECVSRGWANRAIFTDTAPESVRAIKLNARGFDGAAAEIVIQRRDAIAAAAEYGAAADLVFMDPPYANPTLGAQLLEKLAAAAKPGTIIVWEMEKEPSVSGKFEILKDKIYGRARFVIMRKLPPPKSC